MSDFLVTGGCGCGTVRYEVTEPMAFAIYCHCTRCQRRTGTASAVSAAPYAGSFHITSGEDVLRAWKPGDGFDKFFCGECGSAVFARNPHVPEQVAIRMGTFDGDPGVRPIARQFVKYAAVWEPIPDDGLPRFEERRTPLKP